MAITGIVFMGYVLAHMLGNLKLYQSAEDFNLYAEFLRRLLYPIVPERGTLNLLRLVLIARAGRSTWSRPAQLTAMNRKARPEQLPLQARLRRGRLRRPHDALDRRHRAAVHRLPPRRPDLGLGQPGRGGATVYEKVVASFSNPAVAAFYLVANLALGVHLYHGVWSLFQSMGWNNRRFNHWRARSPSASPSSSSAATCRSRSRSRSG
jgi:succinate dehydrogenase / fumarate reductase, cytochrome b subunit